MSRCIIPGCNNPAPYYLGVRLHRPADRKNGRRRPAGTAIWAPNCDANLCAVHASQGFEIEIKLKPVSNRQITTNTSEGGSIKQKRLRLFICHLRIDIKIYLTSPTHPSSPTNHHPLLQLLPMLYPSK
jgi:hypothetical protein